MGIAEGGSHVPKSNKDLTQDALKTSFSRAHPIFLFSYFFVCFYAWSYSSHRPWVMPKTFRSCEVKMQKLCRLFSNESQKPIHGKKLLESNSAADFWKNFYKLTLNFKKNWHNQGTLLFRRQLWKGDWNWKRISTGLKKKWTGIAYSSARLSCTRKKKIRKSVLGLTNSQKNVCAIFTFKKLDYESPLKQEVVSGMISSAMIESTNDGLSFKTLPLMDASLTVKPILPSWRPMLFSIKLWSIGFASIDQFDGTLFKTNVFIYSFILNYNIFGQMSPLTHYLKTNSLAQRLRRIFLSGSWVS